MQIDFDIPAHWSLRRLCDASTIILSNVDKKVSANELLVHLCNYTDVYHNNYIDSTIIFSEGSASAKEVERFQLKAGDVLITKDSEDRHDIAVPAVVLEALPNVLCGYHLAIVRPKNGLLHGEFLAELLQHQRIRYYFSCLANGVTRFGLTTKSIEHARVPIPPFSEQAHIASIARAYNGALKKIYALITKKQLLKKSLMQQLLTGKRRFKGFRKSWRECHLSDIVKIVERPIEWDDDKLYRLASIRRWSGGMFVRDELYGHQIKVKKLRTIKEADFLISHIQSAYGSMALVPKEFDGMHISELYTVLLPKNPDEFDIRYLAYMSQDKYMWHLAYLASNGFFAERLRLSFNPEDFLKHKINIPADIKEQQQIIATLDLVNSEIDLLVQQLELLKQQKRGLMQKLLTGQIRVKV